MSLFVLACAAVAHAQDGASLDVQAPAHVSLVDGVAVLERDGRIDDSPGSMPLLAGDRLRTRGGRVEVLFADGSTLHLDHHTVIDLQSDDLLRLVEGRIRLSIPGPSREVSYRIDGSHGWARITEPGDYRVSLLTNAAGGELELAVIRGRAELANESGETPLRAGERAFARAGAAPSYPYVANSSALDAFDRWSEARRDERMASSAEYLPDEVRPYAASFARYGYWGHEPAYGRVWYPRVAPDWRPYYRGRWASLRPYGWTWIAHDPWGWPTHHYGRWGYSPAGAWFWIPGRTWGAAWVSWAYAPGYVSWCPLGWNNRPVFQININVGRRYDPWRAWTVVPARHFGSGFVHRTVVRASHLDARTLGGFVHRERAPEIRGYAVPRRSAPIRAAGTEPSRRGAAPLYTNVPADQGHIRTNGARVQVPDGARRSPDDGARAIIRERAVPSRPAVRSERSYDGAARREPVDDSRRETAVSPRDVDGARPRPGVSSGEMPRGEAPGYTAPRSAVPRYEPAPERRREIPWRGADAPGRPSHVEPSPSYRAPEVYRGRPPAAERPAPTFERPAPSDSRPAPSYEPRPRAIPRGEPSSPARAAAPPRVERQGPDRAPSGSYERRGPAAAAPPSRPSGGERTSAPPAGARPRPGGGETTQNYEL